MKKIRIILISAASALLLAIIVWIAWANTALELNTYTVSGERLPEAFDGFRIAQISDLHNAEFGKNNEKLLAVLKEAKPNIIVITGDMIDERTDVNISLRFAEEAVKIAPCYYVPGNHESRIPKDYEKLKEGLLSFGVTVLENDRTEIEYNGETISLIGVKDPDFGTDIQDNLNGLKSGNNDYTVLLSHRPERFEAYVSNDMDLVFTGHAHGGQFRLPWVGGLYAPHQGLFPEYDGGLYTDGNTNMIVSRGIGKSAFPFRFNNRPEVVLVELQA